jgi:hypothetical protein
MQPGNELRVAGDILIRGDAFVLTSPNEYDPGPCGKVHWPVVDRARQELIEPVWYVRPDDEAGTRVGSEVPDSRPIRIFGVGFNRDAGTVLECVGRARSADDGPNIWIGLQSRQDASAG